MKIKWGVIGCGGIADRRTLPGMMLADNAELVAVMDANLEVANKVKDKYNAKYAFDKFEDVLALDEIQAVYIASPVFCHKEQAMAAAKAKKHILIEKPMALTSEESQEIADCCKAEGVKLDVELGNMYTKEITSFGNAIANDTEPEITAEDAILVQRICEAAYKSSDSKVISKL